MLARIAAILAGMTVVATAAWAQQRSVQPGGPLDGFDHPRTIHWTPDRRLLVADLGTGHNDGRVVAIDLLGTGKQEVLMKNLPSTRNSGQRYADLSGPSGAAMAQDGTVCVVIGDANKPNRGFGTMRCTDGLVVDLKAYEAANNPDGLDIASNPFDIAWDQAGGWFVSDAAANTVLRIDRTGAVTWSYALKTLPGWPGERQPVPTGLAFTQFGRGDQVLTVALFNGGIAILDPRGNRAPLLAADIVCQCIAIASPDKPTLVLDYASSDGAGSILERFAPDIIRDWQADLDRPTGLAIFYPGSLIVAEEARGRLRIVSPTLR